MVIIVLVVIFMVFLLSLSIYKNPTTTGVGLAIFLAGIPVHYIGNFFKKFAGADKAMGN